MEKIIRNPLLFSVIVFLLVMPITWGLLYSVLSKFPQFLGEITKYNLTLIITIIISIIVYKKIPFTLKNNNFLKGLFTFGLLGFICAIMAFIFSYNKIDIIPNVSTIIQYIIYCLIVAISEEFLFRGLIFNSMLIGFKDKIWISIILSSLIFGLRHLLNLISMPDMVISTIGQVGFTFMAGFYLCSVYLRIKNIWICIFIHFLEDFLTGFWALFTIQKVADGTIISTRMLVLIHSVYIIFGILMLKDKEYKYEPLYEIK